MVHIALAIGTISATGERVRAQMAAAVGAIVLAVTNGAPADVMSTRARHALEAHLKLSVAEIETIDRGGSVAKDLDSGDRREVGSAGAVRVEVPLEFFREQVSDIAAFKQHRVVKQIGKFSVLPMAADLASMTIEPADLDAIRKCRIGDCELSLSAEQISRLQAEMDWSREDASARAADRLRALLLEYVLDYRTRGNGALIEYAGHRAKIRVIDETQLLVERSWQMLQTAPELRALLVAPSVQFPTEPTDGFLYWSKEQFGLKAVISITQVLLHRSGPTETPELTMISKQIYASRYFAGSLAVTLAIAASPDPSCASFYLVYSNRSRPIELPPVIGRLARRIVQSRSRAALEENLQATKLRLEAAYSRR